MSTLAEEIQVGCGKGRDPYKVRAALLVKGKGLTPTELARNVKVAHQVAHETVRGTRNHKRVLDELEKYVPKDVLYPQVPRGQKRTAA